MKFTTLLPRRFYVMRLSTGSTSYQSFCSAVSPLLIWKITTDAHPTHSYRVLPTEHMEDTVLVYNTVLSNLIAADTSSKPDVVNIVEEDILGTVGPPPPCSVYSRTDTNSTQNLTVSAITDNNKSPTKQASNILEEKDWDALVERTDALKKAADNIASAEKKSQEEQDKQHVGAEKMQKEAIKE
eukprot:14304086-Ditylum_brightwellii.AAC.1